MRLEEVNEHILDRYRELIDSEDLTTEEIVKSISSIAISMFENVGVENIEMGNKRLVIEDI